MIKRGLILIFFAITILGVSGQTDLYLAGRASMQKGNYKEASAYLEKALETKPGETEILYNLGICYYRLNNFPKARDAFYNVEKRKKGMGSLYLAKTEVRLNHTSLALKYLKEHLSSRYKVSEKQILLDAELSTLQSSDGWRQLWNEKDWYSEGDRDFQEAQFMKENGMELEAINLLNALEKQGYQKSRVQAEKAEVYAKLNNSKAARSALRSAVKSDVRNLDAVFALSQSQKQEGETEEAMKNLDRVIRQEPDRFEAYLLRAELRSELDDLDGALKDLKLYLSYFPEEHKAYFRQGKIQYSHGRYLDAIKSFNRALEMDQGNADYFYARGLTYASTGTIRSADRDMAMALDLDPLNGEIWFEKANLSLDLGKNEDACSAYRKAFQYGVFEAGEIADKLCK